jgi:hypothetical protein
MAGAREAVSVETIIQSRRTNKLVGRSYHDRSQRPRAGALRALTFVRGPSRNFAAKQRFGRFQVKADIRWQAGPADSIENDPQLTSTAKEVDQINVPRINLGTIHYRWRS